MEWNNWYDAQLHSFFNWNEPCEGSTTSDFAAMEARRMRAADLFAKSVSQADIGRELEVSHQTVSDWHEKWAVGGKRALKRTGQPGRPPKVNEANLAKVARALQRDPRPTASRPSCGPWLEWPT